MNILVLVNKDHLSEDDTNGIKKLLAEYASVVLLDIQTSFQVVSELECLRDTNKQFKRIYDFMRERGFAVPGTTDDVVISEIKSLDRETRFLEGKLSELTTFVSKRKNGSVPGEYCTDSAISIIKNLDTIIENLKKSPCTCDRTFE
jgi:hypothetical protein